MHGLRGMCLGLRISGLANLNLEFFIKLKNCIMCKLKGYI